MRLEIYTDGAAMNNGRAGSIGYAAVLFHSKKADEFSGGEAMDPSSSNVAELKAVRLGLQEAKQAGFREAEVFVFSDSEYAVNSITGKWGGTSNRLLILEVRALYRLFSRADISWVRGHCGHAFNERAHRLANHQARKAYEPCDIQHLFKKRSRPALAPQPALELTEEEKQERGAIALSQARLDRIAAPTNVYFSSLVKWTNRFNNDPRYTDELLKEQLEFLGPKLSALKVTVHRPPVGMTAEQWLEDEDRVRKMQGQFDALMSALTRRTRNASFSSRLGRKPSTTTAVLEPPAEDLTDDPFAKE
jgi:ribonuclease HI